jgi:eukaryotic-like serine/threonine-protein kinase
VGIHVTAIPGGLIAALQDRYAIERELGSGGMATVYLAEDVKHHRKVAIKVLHPELSAVIGPERFLKEIELTASLQHPHILPLFDSGSADGLLYYVMPYVEGETLRGRLEREQQLPIADALRIATEIADALEYAHKRGVVHRDVKPENILLHDGRPLVADFGIALAVQQAGGARMTQTGMSLGTPQYMAPEQAMGDRNVDHRADIYALGAVTYEMLAGEPPFTGPNSQAIVAKVLTTDPISLTVKRRSVPQHVADAILAALEKMPADRQSSAAELAAALRGDGTSTTRPRLKGATAAPRSLVSRVALPGAVALLVALAAWGWLRPSTSADPGVVRFRIPIPIADGGSMRARLAFSRDGTTLAYSEATASSSGVRIRRLDHADATLVSGTDGAVAQAFSPDGTSLVFVTASKELKTVSLAGGTPVVIARRVDGYTGVDWAADGFVYFVSTDSQVVSRVSSSGGAVEHVGNLESSELPVGFTTHRYPVTSEDGRSVLFTVYRGPARESEIGVVDLRSGTTRMIGTKGHALGVRWGHLLYVTADGTLWAVPFDSRRLEPRGSPTALVPGIRTEEGVSDAVVGSNGALAYVAAVPAASELVWVTRDGVETSIDPGLRMAFDAVAISPDGNRLALSARETGGTGSVWIYDLWQHTLSRFTQDGALNFRPVWTPDGANVVYASDRGSEARARALWIRRADASDTARLVVGSRRHAQEISWPAQGNLVVYREGYDDGGMNRDIRYLALNGDTTTYPVLATRADELNPSLSPDGRWLAYVSNESGRDEVYVTSFPGSGTRVQVSRDGGTSPRWAHGGTELFYRSSDNQLMAMDVVTSPALAIARRRALFPVDAYSFDRQYRTYDVSPDGGRFLFIKPPPSLGLEVVANWGAEVLPRLRERR